MDVTSGCTLLIPLGEIIFFHTVVVQKIHRHKQDLYALIRTDVRLRPEPVCHCVWIQDDGDHMKQCGVETSCLLRLLVLTGVFVYLCLLFTYDRAPG